MRRAYPASFSFQEVIETIFEGFFTASFSKGRGFGALRSMPNKLIRRYGRGHLHFITFTCYRRLPLLRSVRARSVF